MFTRFSPAANRILRLAEQECRNLNHYYVGAEHLLLALCDEPDQATAAYLAEHRLSKDRLRAALRRSLGTGEDRMWDGILVTPRVRAIVERAENAVGAGNTVEPVDLLRAIVAERLSTAAEILAQSEGNVRRAG